jgi:hypothetical protein
LLPQNPSNLSKHLSNHHLVDDAPNFFNAATKQPGDAPCISGLTVTDSFSCNTREASSTIHTYFSELSTKEAMEMWSQKAHLFFT